MSLQAGRLQPNQDAEYHDFLDRLGQTSPAVLGYHYPVYRDMLCHAGIGEPVYLGARQEGRLTGVLPAFRRKTAAGTVYSSLPFFGPNAGVLCESGETRKKIHESLLTALLDQARADEALSCSVYTPFLDEDFQGYEAVFGDAVKTLKFTQYNELGAPVWEHGALGRNLKKAKRSGMIISAEVTAEKLECFYALYEQECRANGIPVKPKAGVFFLAEKGVASGRAKLYFAYLNGQMAGGLMVLWSPQTVSYYIPCVHPDAKTHQPGVALIQHAMECAAQAGLRFWNWESSPDRESGVYRFKKKWSAVEASYRIYLKIFCKERLEELGREGIVRHFPFFYVYPFSQLRENTLSL